MSEWQDISTAPKDGTRIIVYRPKHDGKYIPKVGMDYWGEFGHRMSWAHSRSDTPPTHWQPFPAPPGDQP